MYECRLTAIRIQEDLIQSGRLPSEPLGVQDPKSLINDEQKRLVYVLLR
jgi:hypothetical protein